jgi:hypothetical protein
MKTLLAITLLLALLIGANVEAGHGHHSHHRQQVVLVASPYAVPVGIPIAPAAGVEYRKAQQAPAPPPKSDIDLIADAVFARIQAMQAGHVNAQGKITAFGRDCASCHQQNNTFKAPVFLSYFDMTEEQRLQAEEEIDESRMPKNKPATPEQAGEHFREIRAARKAHLQAKSAESPKPQVQPMAVPQSEAPSPTPEPPPAPSPSP